jgi:hypothetical protein
VEEARSKARRRITIPLNDPVLVDAMAVVGPGRALRDPHITAAEPGRQHRRQVYASGAMRRVVRNSPAERLGDNLEDLSLHL